MYAHMSVHRKLLSNTNKKWYNLEMQKQIFKTFLVLVMFFALPHFAEALFQQTNYSHIKLAAQNFQSHWLTGSKMTNADGSMHTITTAEANAMKAWEAAHIDLFTGGDSLLSFNPNTISGGYQDNTFVYLQNLNQVRDSAAAHGFNFEDMLWHSKVDYQVSTNPDWRWTAPSVFDSQEVNSIGVYQNGVLLYDGTTYSDVTNYATASTVPNHKAGGVVVTNQFLVGSSDPFDQVNFSLSAVAAGKTVTVEYWNGAWTTLAITDGTNNLTTNGQVYFSPPSDWSKTSFNGSYQKWWVKFTVTGTGTNPTIASITGDNWLSNNGTYNSRGWDETDGGNCPGSNCHIVNYGQGELEYNPTPPTGASAKFRHQARLTGIFGSNAVLGNPSNIQNGQITWANFLADRALMQLNAGNGNGFLFDDGNGSAQIYAPVNMLTTNINTATDFVGSQTQAQARYAAYTETINLIKANPNFANIKIGTLSQTHNLWALGDYDMWECAENPPNMSAGFSNIYQPDYIYGNSFDSFLTANNPTNTKGIFMPCDDYTTGYSVGVDYGGGWVPWDRANRGPILTLAQYYIGANDNMYFNYNNGYSSYNQYNFPGAYHYWSTNSTPLTTALTVNTLSGTVNIYGADFSAFPSSAYVLIGDQVYYYTSKSSNTHLVVYGTIQDAQPINTPIKFLVDGNFALSNPPAGAQMESYGMWFPAEAVDIGAPVSARSISGDVSRRYYANALILARLGTYSATAASLTVPSAPIELDGTYYLLNADGTTGPPITEIALRNSEGAILMKAPVGNDIIAPNAPSSLSVQ